MAMASWFAYRRRRSRNPARDQCHAVHRRHPGAADHLHGGRAARDRRYRRQPARQHRPRAAARPDKPVFLTIKSDETIAVGDTVVAREALANALDTATNNRKDATIFVRADKTLSYGDLMGVMNTFARRRLSQARLGRAGRTGG